MRTHAMRAARPAFTLLEMILAALVAVLLLGALYVAMDLQLRHAEAARDVVVETALARTLFNRITADITPSLAQADPTRFTSQSGSGGSMGGAAGGATTGAGGAGAAAGGSGAGASGGATGAATGGASSTSAIATGSQTILVMQGDASSLTLFISRLPPDPNNTNNPLAQQPFSDQRRIVYWLADGGGNQSGLARQELMQVTSSDAVNGTMPDVSDPNAKVLAPEVKRLQFQYFDGSDWQDSWDGTQVGSDGVTPVGAPQAVAITLDLARPDGEVKTYRHVVAIPSANNPTPSQPQSSTTGSGGTTGGTGSGTTP